MYVQWNYSARRRNGVLVHATMSMNLRKVMQVKEARHNRPYIISSHLCEVSGIGKSIETKGRLVVASWLGVMGIEGATTTWLESSFWGYKMS